MTETELWTSDVCVCGHHMHHHYRKNYLRRDSQVQWGNVDFHGCDLCEVEGKRCSHIDDNGEESRGFKHLKVPQDFWAFENDFPWDIKDRKLLALYNKEVRGGSDGKPLMRAYQWILENPKRYLSLLKGAGVNMLVQRGVRIRDLPFQSRIILEAIQMLPAESVTGEIYSQYEKLVRERGYSPLTKRRVASLLSQLTDVGVIESKLVSMGRYGRTKRHTLKGKLKFEERTDDRVFHKDS